MSDEVATPGLDLLEALLAHQCASSFLAPTQGQEGCMKALVFILKAVNMQARYCLGTQAVSRHIAGGLGRNFTLHHPMLVVDGVMHNCNGYVGQEAIEEHLAMQLLGSPDLTAEGQVKWRDIHCDLDDYEPINADGPTRQQMRAVVAEGVAFAQDFLLRRAADLAQSTAPRPRL